MAAAVFALASFAGTAEADSTVRSRTGPVTREYDATCVAQSWLLGGNWRALWSEPIEVEVLDLGTTAGGLSPERTVGGLQTRGLALAGGDGRSYTFRPLEKRADAGVPPWLPFGGIAALLRDLGSGNFPGANLVATHLSRRLGMRMTSRKLVVMPDDARLEEHREEFAGVVGTFAEYPQPASPTARGTFGFAQILSTADLWEARRRSAAARIDARAYLRARLLDWWIGDWDRHPGQWRWGLSDDDEARYEPIPEDHDNALTDFDGALIRIALQPFLPWLGPLERDLSLRGMTHHSWWLDAWLLAELDRSAWLEEIAAFESDTGPAAIDDALRSLPGTWRTLRGEDLRAVLLARRSTLRRHALAIYASIARIVHLYGTDDDDRVEVSCDDEGTVHVELSTGGRARLRRSFHPDETERIVMHGFGGVDRVVRDASTRCPVPVRQRSAALRMRLGVPAPVDRVHDPRRPGRGRVERRF